MYVGAHQQTNKHIRNEYQYSFMCNCVYYPSKQNFCLPVHVLRKTKMHVKVFTLYTQHKFHLIQGWTLTPHLVKSCFLGQGPGSLWWYGESCYLRNISFASSLWSVGKGEFSETTPIVVSQVSHRSSPTLSRFHPLTASVHKSKEDPKTIWLKHSINYIHVLNKVTQKCIEYLRHFHTKYYEKCAR